MTTPGQFQVSESGAATYTIPIQVPLGVGGMEPKLSLNYSSQSGNGLLGVGWSLGGLGGVSRCPRTIAQDGVRGGVNYDANDRYCLDGQRLIAISGTEGGDGTEYRTERESFAKIVSYGSAGNGPAWFKVWTKAGQVMEYGNTADSKILPLGRVSITIWALSKILDVKGNYLTAIWNNDAQSGDYYPLQVDYTSNAATGLVSHNSVHFLFEPRPDILSLPTSGKTIRNRVRLQRIEVYSDAYLTKKYDLSYSQGEISNRSRLISVKECAADVCLPKITFNWDVDEIKIQNKYWSGLGVDTAGSQMSDIFGDGRPLYNTHSTSGAHSAIRFNLDGTSQTYFWPSGIGVMDAGWQMVDLFGDGRPMYYTHSLSGAHAATRFNTDGTLKQFTWQALGVETAGWQMADLFGEGRQLYYTHSTSGLHAATRFNSDGSVQNIAWSGGLGVDTAGWQMVDLFGDGRQMYYTHSTAGTHSATRFNPDGTLQNFFWSGGLGVDNGGWAMADLFGDGRQMYYTHSTAGVHGATRLNPDGTVENFTWTGGPGIDDTLGWQMVDLFGDGRMMYYTHSVGGAHSATRFNPDGTLQNFRWTGGAGLDNGGWNLTDLFGEGRPVYYTYSTAGGHTMTRFLSAGLDKISSVGNGTGVVLTLTYAPLTNDIVYSKDSTATAAYPILDIQAPLSVVSSVVSTNGIGGITSTSYTYGGLKSDLSGRGLLGFRWVQAKQVETGLTSYTEYQQNWPYTGLPSLVKKSLTGGGNSGVLSQISNSYNCNDPVSSTAVPCVVGAGKRYFVYANQSVESSWDYNGAVLPVITTKTEYDNWGNAFKVDVSTSDGYGKSTINSYSNDSSNWHLGRLLKSSVSSTAP